MLNEKWQSVINKSYFVYQPIVNIYSGVTFGFEAFLRGFEEFGYSSVDAFFDAAYNEQVLVRVELELRKKAAIKFLHLGFQESIRLFYRFDKRVITMSDFYHESIRDLTKSMDVLSDFVYLELSERHGTLTITEINAIVSIYGQHGYRIGIDDYGTGCFSFRMLYNITPDFIKIDRFFIQDIDKDIKKKMFLTHLASIAKMFGITMVAKGVESLAEYYVCKEIGINLIQGYIVDIPRSEPNELKVKYEHVEAMHQNDKRASSHRKTLENNIEIIAPIYIDDEMLNILETFRKNKHLTFLPVIDNIGIPQGIIKDKELKDYVYSTYGTALLKNKSAIKSVEQFLTKCPVADIHSEIESLLELYSQNPDSAGIIITEDMKYKGFMSSRELLNALNEKNMATARDQNPLTKLPGNNKINEFIAKCLGDDTERFMLAYFDFDNFKPFNDKYGFRNGDRAILLFADLLREELATKKFFIGHIGGDDFFAGFHGSELEYEEFYAQIKGVSERFRHDVESFYSEDDRKAGFVMLKDREGAVKKFPLLSVSAGLVQIEKPDELIVNAAMDELFSKLKKGAKASPDRLCGAAIITDVPL